MNVGNGTRQGPVKTLGYSPDCARLLWDTAEEAYHRHSNWQC